jgi:hypothetical protein
VSLVWAIVITVGASSVAVATMLFVRRRAPEGSFFADGDRAAGVFGVLATGFAILLGLIVVIAFTSYDDSRRGAEQEALHLAQQFRIAQFFPDAQRRRLSDEITCYARSVVHQEWPRLRSGAGTAPINAWAVALFRTLETVEPRTAAEQSAYDKWLDTTSDREEARRDRTHGAAGVIPESLWIVLFFIAATIFVFMLFFADSAERAISQAVLMGSVAAVITATLLTIQFLDDPFRGSYGGLNPDDMQHTLTVIDLERRIVGQGAETLPCNAAGVPTRS